MSLSEKIKKGNKLYYPSVKGIALLCEVLEESESDFLVDIEGRLFYLPKTSVDAHAILLDDVRSKMFVAQRLEDPENTLVYMRFKWNETLVDKMYNRYCKWKNRVERVVFPGDTTDPVAGAPEAEYEA